MSTKTTTKTKKKTKAKKLHKLSIERPHGKVTCFVDKQSGVLGPKLEPQGKVGTTPVPEKPKEKIPLVQTWKKKASKRRYQTTSVNAFCCFPDLCENRSYAATLLVLVLLCQVSPFLIGDVPTMPIILLPAASKAVVPLLHTLITAIQGPEVWKGENWKLKRPWYIKPRPSLMETEYSPYIVDYIGGHYKKWDETKRRFWFPYIGSTVILEPSLPVKIQKIMMEQSVTSLIIVFGQPPKGTTRWTLPLLQEAFLSYDKEKTEVFQALSQDIHQEVISFLMWFCSSKKNRNQWLTDLERFRPVTQRGRFSQPLVDEQTDLLCAALSLFKQLLFFSTEVIGLLSPEMAHEILMEYWQLVLPQSAPVPVEMVGLEEMEPESVSSIQTYDSPTVFFRFLTEYYLPTYQKQLCTFQRGTPGTMGLIWELHEDLSLILPRRETLESYSHWLLQQGLNSFSLSKKNEAADIQRTLQDAGIPLRGEKNDPTTWRFQFYEKNAMEALPNGKLKIPCLSLSLSNLPEEVRICVEDLFCITAKPVGKPNAPEIDSDLLDWR